MLEILSLCLPHSQVVFPEGQEDAGSRQGRPSENPSRNVLCLQQGQGQRQDIQPKTGRAKFV